MKLLLIIFTFIQFSLIAQDLRVVSISNNYKVKSPDQYFYNRNIQGYNKTNKTLFFNLKNSELEKLINLECKYKLKNKWKKINTKDFLTHNLGSSFKSDVEYIMIPIPAFCDFKITADYEGVETMFISRIQINMEDVDTLITEITIPFNYTISLHEDLNNYTKSVFQDSIQKYVFKNNGTFKEDKSVAIIIHLESETKIDYFNDWYLDRLNGVIGKSISSVDQFKIDDSDTLTWMRSVFNIVQSKISYVDIEDGLGAFVPRLPFYTWENKYGDCKDMAFLLTKIYRNNGVEANMAISRTLSLEKEFDFPSIALANHAICVVNYDNKVYYLDATERYCKFGNPSSQIQNCEILVVDKLRPRFEKINYLTPEQNLDSTIYFINLTNKSKNSFSRCLKGKSMLKYVYRKSNSGKNNYQSQLNDESIIRHEGMSFSDEDSLFLIKADPFLLPESYTYFEDRLMLPKSIFMDIDFLYLDTTLNYLPLYQTYKKTQTVRIYIGEEVELQDSYNYSFEIKNVSYSIKIKSENKEVIINESMIINKVSLTNNDLINLAELYSVLKKRKSGYILINYE